ncbi:hypothetical protein LIER_37740 [Lithospermum erythrorhizon]|uniref:Retrotransposon gag domain-containing protein n=1 Tax=Lithospermum erythrorhizon TaxID=34254 RepID=A0AAV3PRL3_LITER
MFADNAMNLWDEIKEEFGGYNGPRMYELRRSTYAMKRGEEKMMQFLMGIGEEYDATRNQILLMEPLLSLARAYSMVTNAETTTSWSGAWFPGNDWKY